MVGGKRFQAAFRSAKGDGAETALANSDVGSDKPRSFKNFTLSKMRAQVFRIDATKCPHCSGKLVKVCAVTDRSSKYSHLLLH